MSQQAINNLSDKKNSIVLLQGVFVSAFFEELKKKNPANVFVMEGRPTLEAAQSSSVELLKRKITPTLISDNMAGFLFFKGLVKEVCVAYQMSDKDGALCDIGALILGVLAKKHNVPVYLYPSRKQSSRMGKQKDIFYFNGKRVAPAGIRGYVPLMEWVPSQYMMNVYEPAKH